MTWPHRLVSVMAGDAAGIGLAHRLIAGLAVIVLLVVGAGGWAATAKIAGAVIAPGVLVVDASSKKVQHPTGGVIGAINVRNGMRVEAGDLLVRLDETQVRAALGIVVGQLMQLTGRKSRLEAERDGAATPEFPSAFEAQNSEAHLIALGERRLFEARRSSTRGQKRQQAERIGQLKEEIAGLSAQLAAKEQEFGYITLELGRLDVLHEKRLVNETRMLAMKREEIRIRGEIGAFVSQIARARGQISQTELQIIQIEQEVRTEAHKELREVEARIAELSERRVGAEDQLQRIDIRAPIGGIVHELGVHTVGGVIQAGETLMQIVPVNGELTIEARLAPADIDHVAVGRKSTLRFSAFNQRTTPEVSGVVVFVSADLSKDPASGASYYTTRIRLDADGANELADLKFVPGMPVETFIETQERTALSYLMKPFTDQVARIFRDP
jgi:HlyD family secretion protein